MSLDAATKIQALVRRALVRERVYVALVRVWERIYDPVQGAWYYYNVQRDVAQWKRPAPLMWRDIADAAPTFTESQAALFVQCAWRRLAATRVARARLAKVVREMTDEASGAVYYYNSLTGATSWTRPRLLGGETQVDDDEDDDDVESLEDEEEDDDDDGDDREWPRSKAQRLVDAAEDEGAEELVLRGIGLRKLTYRIFSVESLVRLDIAMNKIVELPPELGTLTKLEVLDASDNKLTELPREMEDLTALRTLDASRNRIASYSPHVYRLAQLEDWRLSENLLDELPLVVGDVDLLRETRVWEVGLGMMTQLRRLDASWNRISSWPQQMDQLANLEELALAHNQLPSMEGGLPPHLRILDVSHNQIQVLNPDVVTLTGLEALDVSCNALTDLPEGLHHLQKLERMPLHTNRLTKLSVRLSDLGKLKKLELATNRLDDVAKAFRKKTKLTSVDLDNNQLTEVPKDMLVATPALVCLSMRNNRLEKLPSSIGSLVRLETLVLANNHISTLPRLAALVSLTRLDVGRNDLAEIPTHILGLRSLRHLNVSWNRLVRFDMAGVKQASLPLQTLDLSHNEISDLSAEVCHRLPDLERLVLDYNRFERIPAHLADAPKLVSLTFDHNPLVQHVIDVLAPFGRLLRRKPHFKLNLSSSSSRQLDDDEDASDAAQRSRLLARTRNRASAGAERLERGEYEEAISPLRETTELFDRLFPNSEEAPTAAHHFFLGAALLAQVRARDYKHHEQNTSRKSDIRSSRASRRQSLDSVVAEAIDLSSNVAVDPEWKAERSKLLGSARRALDAAFRIKNEARLGDPYPEIVFCRALVALELEDYASAIRDISDVLALRPDHTPSLLVRAKARCALGQFPQAERDCSKIRRCDGPVPQDLARLECKVHRGLKAIRFLGCDDAPNMERCFEVTPDGLLLRRRSELAALKTTGRSLQRDRIEERNRRRDAKRQAAEDKARDIADERAYCCSLADRVRADLAWRSAVYARERDVERNQHKAQEEARLQREKDEAAAAKRQRDKENEQTETAAMQVEDQLAATARSRAAAAAIQAEEDKADEDDLLALKNSRRRVRRGRGGTTS